MARMARMARMGKDGQGWARMALKAKGLKALNPCQELTLKLVATHPPDVSLALTNGLK